MIVTDDEQLAAELRQLRFHGSQTKYFHNEIGYNSRLDELQAAILRVKFRYLEQWNEERRAKAQIYDHLLADSNIILPGRDPEALPVYHLYVLRTDEREALMAKLNEAGIANAIYYPLPLHLQPALKYLGYQAGAFPVAEKACQQALAIPCYPELTLEQQQQIVTYIRS